MASIGQYRGTDITPGSDEQVRAQIDAIDASQPISTQSLQQQPAFTIPPAPTPTASAGFQGQMETFVGSLQSAADASKKQKDQSGRMLADALFNQQGEADLTNMLYGSDDGVDDRRAELDDINQQILQEQEGLRREIEAIQDNTEGLTRGAVAGRIDETRRKSLRTQADLAIISLARQGKYDSAKAVADRAIAVQLEKDRQRNDLLKFIFEENKSLFNKAEERAFSVAQKEREQEYEAKEYRLRAEFDNKIKQQDPLYQLQIAKTRKELQLLGQETPTERAKREKEETAALKEAQASIPVMRDKVSLIDSLKDHAGMAGTVGPYKISRFTPFTPDKAQRQEFIGGVQKLVGGLTLDNLIAAKARGATFGALSEGELNILASSATAINSWALKDDNDQVYGYAVSEATFNKELDTIKELTERALLQSGQSLISDEERDELYQVYEETAPFDPAAYF